MRPKNKRTWGSVLLLLFSVLITLFAVEVVLRHFRVAPNFMMYDELRGWGLRPGTAGQQSREGSGDVVINSKGFRGPELNPVKSPGTTRILVLGDSFAAAIHVPSDKTFCEVLKAELARRPCRIGLASEERSGRADQVEVLNLGVSGYGTAQEYLTLLQNIDSYDPDIVVLAFLTGNDISDNSPFLQNGSLFDGESCRPYVHPGDRGLEISRAYAGQVSLRLVCWLNFEARRFALVRLMGTAAYHLFGSGGTTDADKRNCGSEPGIDDDIYGPPKSAEWEEAWDTTEGLIVAISREAAARGKRVLVVTLSNPIQVYPDEACRRRYLDEVGGTDFFYPERRIQALGKSYGFEVLTLAPAMQEAADREHVFYHGFSNTRLGMGHWNVHGHEFAGKAIARVLGGEGDWNGSARTLSSSPCDDT